MMSRLLGLEGGIHKIGDVWFQCGWCVVVDRDVGLALFTSTHLFFLKGKKGVGSSARYQLSNVIVEPLLKEGKELAEVSGRDHPGQAILFFLGDGFYHWLT